MGLSSLSGCIELATFCPLMPKILELPTQEIEELLFHRFAKNYSFLLFDWHRFHHQEALIKARYQPKEATLTNWDYSHLELEKFKMNNFLSPKGEESYLQTQDAKLEKDKKESVWKQSQHMLKTRRLKIAPHPRESHPTCCGSDLTWHLFNINGHSPLIHHFLQSCNAEPWSGRDILIHRREIANPIPYP
ncbi:protein FAM227A [Phoenicopterus ruber ruber]